MKTTKALVIKALKGKEACLVQVNPNINTMVFNEESKVIFKLICDEAEIVEQWSFVGKKSNQRWLWYAIDHVTGTILAYVFGNRKDDVFRKLKALEPFGIQRFYTDDWGAYEQNIDQKKHSVGKGTPKNRAQESELEDMDQAASQKKPFAFRSWKKCTILSLVF